MQNFLQKNIGEYESFAGTKGGVPGAKRTTSVASPGGLGALGV